MIIYKVFRRLQWRLILLHTLGLCFLYSGTNALYLSTIAKYIPLLKTSPNKLTIQLGIEKITWLAIWLQLSGDIGLLIGLVLSILFAWVYKRYWLNVLIAFLAAILIFRYLRDTWDWIVWFIPHRFKFILPLDIRFISVSVLFMSVGISLLLLPKIFNNTRESAQLVEAEADV